MISSATPSDVHVATKLAATRVALRVADPPLAARVRAVVCETGRFAIAQTLTDADVLVSDRLVEASVPVVVVGSAPVVAQALRMGAAGGLAVSFRDGQLRAMIEAVAVGLFCTDQRPSGRGPAALPDQDHALSDEVETLTPPLTSREADVLSLMTTGASNKQIARQLNISVHTVKFHVAAIIAKLGARGRTDAVARTLRAGQTMI